MATIGTSKTLNNGSTIKFTRKNPTTTLKAINKFLIGEGFELDYFNIARTGSQYLSMYRGDFEINVRSANHTQGFSTKEVQLSLETRDDNGTISIDIDLSEGRMGIAEFKALYNEIKSINESGVARGMVADYKANGTSNKLAESSELVQKCVNDWLESFFGKPSYFSIIR